MSIPPAHGRPNQPAIYCPPASPCFECFRHGTHEVKDRGVITCDSIMAAMGSYFRQKEAERKAT